MKRWLVVVALVALVAPAMAQSPYAGMQTRPLKALSEAQIADLKAGRGMGLALAAELNGYPGPSHLLELADQLDLSATQRAAIARLFAAMKQEAILLGARLLEEEAELDRLFAGRTITPNRLRAATAAIAAAQAALRETHLKYHLLTGNHLSVAQMQRYAALRGYAGGGIHPHEHR